MLKMENWLAQKTMLDFVFVVVFHVSNYQKMAGSCAETIYLTEIVATFAVERFQVVWRTKPNLDE